MEDQNQNQNPGVSGPTIIQPTEALPQESKPQPSDTSSNPDTESLQTYQPQPLPNQAHSAASNSQVFTNGSTNLPGQSMPPNKAPGRSKLIKTALIAITAVLLIGCISAYAYSHINSTTVACGSETCLSQKFTSCSPATYRSPTTDQSSITYHIYGKKGSGCNMQFWYTANPNRDWVNKPLTCNFDNSKSLGKAVLAVLVSPTSYKCSGPLVSVIEISNSNENLNSNVTSNNISQNTNNTARQQDASTILSAINEYISNNNGALPQTASPGTTSHTLLLCSGSCTSSNSSSAKLGFYSPTKVSFRAYASNLVAPDDETVYIVNGATCTNDSAIGTQSSGVSEVVIYASQNGSDIKQQCQAS
jgi:hypothetical protein